MALLPRNARILIGVLALGALLSAAGAVLVASRTPAPPVIVAVPPFQLTTHQKTPATVELLRGHLSVVDFIFTSCPTICPVMTRHMGRLRSELPPGTRLVSFTVDPQNDTPERLAEYARKNDAGPEWTFVTGPMEDLHRLANDGFKLPVQPIPQTAEEGPFLHSQRFVLVDDEGRIRGYYDSSEPEALQQLVRDARRIAP